MHAKTRGSDRTIQQYFRYKTLDGTFFLWHHPSRNMSRSLYVFYCCCVSTPSFFFSPTAVRVSAALGNSKTYQRRTSHKGELTVPCTLPAVQYIAEGVRALLLSSTTQNTTAVLLLCQICREASTHIQPESVPSVRRSQGTLHIVGCESKQRVYTESSAFRRTSVL